MLGVAYLDGKTPSVLVVRGTYGLMKRRRLDAAGTASCASSGAGPTSARPFKYQGQGQHSIKVGDIDGDGEDEILNGSIAIDNDGRTMWSTGLGHGDRFYLSDIDPRRPGLEIWYTIEDPHPQNGVSLWDAKSGALIFGTPEPIIDNQVAGGLAGDIDPAHPGMEVWGDRFFYTAGGQALEGPPPPQNELVWWDADPLRELHSKGRVSKWKGAELAATEGSVQHVADIIGDWREEIVTFADGDAAHLQHADPRHRSARLPDAGSALPQRRHPSLDGLPARADDQLLPGHAGGAGQERAVKCPGASRARR